jgi:hypothetical protein
MEKTNQTVLSDVESIRAKEIERAKQIYFLLNEYTFNNSKSVNASIKSSFY